MPTGSPYFGPAQGNNTTGDPGVPYTFGKTANSYPPPPGIPGVMNPPGLPMPDAATGEVFVRREAVLTAKKFNLALTFEYASQESDNAEFGLGRSSSIDCKVVSSTSATSVTIIHGDFRQLPFTKVGASGGITTYQAVAGKGVVSTLSYDGTEFTEYMNDGMRLIYKAQVGGGNPVTHQLIRQVDPSGVAQTLNYGSGVEAELVRSIDLPGPRRVTLSYAASTGTSLLSTVDDWGGRRWTLQYDANRCLTTFMTPLGCTQKYLYSATGGGSPTLLSSMEDERGYISYYNYDSQNRVREVRAGSGIWTWAYLASNNIVTAPSGVTTSFQYSAENTLGMVLNPDNTRKASSYQNRVVTAKVSNNPSGISFVYSTDYDTQFWAPTAIEDPAGRITSYQYDSFGNVVSQLGALQNMTTIAYEGTGSTRLPSGSTDCVGRSSSYSHYADGMLKAVRDPRGLVTTYVYDTYGNLATVLSSDGQLTTNTYDTWNRLQTVTDPLGRVSSYSYDANDNLTSEQDPTGALTTYVYDSCLRVAVRDARNKYTTYTYDRFRNMESVMNALKFVTTNLYDSMGYQTGVQDALNNLTTMVYNAAGQKVADIDQLGNYTTYGYDTGNRLVSLTNARGSVTTYFYDDVNNVTGIQDATGALTSYMYDNLYQRIQVASPLGQRWTTVYDCAGQKIADVNPLGQRTSYAYDASGNLTTITDALGRITSNIFETNSNRLAATVDPLSSRTSFAYDAAGQRIEVQDARGNRTSFVYNGAGRVWSIRNPLNRILTTTYYPTGDTITITHQSGRETRIHRDAIGRPVTTMYTEQLTPRVTLLFDALSRRTTMIDGAGITSYSYNARGDMIQKILPGHLVLTMSYDSVGNRSLLVDPDGGYATMIYDALNRIATQTDPEGLIVSVQYDAAGRKTTQIFGNARRRLFQYDAADRMTTQIEQVSATGAPVQTLLYEYDAVGNRTKRNLDSVITTWTYDNANRLTGQQKASEWGTYTYDGVGNILLKAEQGSSPITFLYNAFNQITTMNQGGTWTTYAYGETGSLAQEVRPAGNRTTYYYDQVDRLTQIQSIGGVRSTYTYDGDGLRRTAQESGAVLTTFVWDGTDYLGEI